MPPYFQPADQSPTQTLPTSSTDLGKFIFWAGVLVLFLLNGSGIAKAQALLEIQEPTVIHSFGEWIQFDARILTEFETENVILFFRPEGPYETFSAVVPLEAGETFSYRFDLVENRTYIPPFTTVHYWFQLDTGGADLPTSSSNSFIYEDNRFEWRTITDGPVRIHWYVGDSIYAQQIADRAQLGLQQLEATLSDDEMDVSTVTAQEGIDIYAYASVSALQSALPRGGPAWVAGHADPELGKIFVSLPPGPEQVIEMERQIPHELAHILFYKRLGPGYHSLPIWLNEGLASTVELFPNTNYQLLLESAVADDRLIPIADLCEQFPDSASQVILAYAQSTAFTNYLIAEFGNTAIRNLMSTYANGVSCQRGVEEVYGLPLAQLEKEWRAASLGENAWQNLYPWFALSGLILAPMLILGWILLRRGERESGPLASEEFLGS
jgi:hypothetical protein